MTLQREFRSRRLNSRSGVASKSAAMKTLLAATTLALLLTATGATAVAHERSDAEYWAYRHRMEASRYEAPEVLYDRYGNQVIFSNGRRYLVSAEDNCRRAPIVVPECHRAPTHFEPPFVGVLKSIFRH